VGGGERGEAGRAEGSGGSGGRAGGVGRHGAETCRGEKGREVYGKRGKESGKPDPQGVI